MVAKQLPIKHVLNDLHALAPTEIHSILKLFNYIAWEFCEKYAVQKPYSYQRQMKTLGPYTLMCEVIATMSYRVCSINNTT